MSLNINQKIESFTAERAKHVGAMTAVLEAAGDASLDATQQEQYDDAEANIGTIDKHLDNLRKAQSAMASTATVVVPAADGKKAASQIVVPHRDGVIAVARKEEPGVGFARMATLMARAKGNYDQAARWAKSQFPEDRPLHDFFQLYADGRVDNEKIAKGEFAMIMKTAVAAGTTTDTHWAAPLVYAQNIADEFMAWLRPRIVIDRIPGMRRVPFNVKVPKQVTGGAAYWVGEGKPKPLTSFNFEQVSLGYTKIANISVITQELARLSSPAAEVTVRDQLGAAIIQQMDADFLDPANAGTANVKPASITNGSPTVAATGTAYANLVADLKSLFNIWIANNMSTASGVWIMSESQALSFSLMLNPLGQPYFPGLNQTGGTFFGLPVIVSQTAGLHGTSGSESIIVLANPSNILIADDGRVTVDSSGETALQMLDNPTNASSDGTATTMVSMFQTDSLAIRGERWICWTKGRAEAAVYITNANYG
jgi:HK97 family phage major capsid protein